MCARHFTLLATNSLFAWIILLLAIQEEARIFGQQKPNPDGIAKPKILRKSRGTIIKFLPMSANYFINPYPFHFNLSPVFLWFCFFRVGEHDYQ